MLDVKQMEMLGVLQLNCHCERSEVALYATAYSVAISNVNGDCPAVQDPFGASTEGLPSEGKERLATTSSKEKHPTCNTTDTPIPCDGGKYLLHYMHE